MVFIGLGANLESVYGAPYETLRRAVLALKEQNLNIIATSRIWQSSPVPASDQPDFFNCIIRVDTYLEPIDLLRILHVLEQNFGRVRTVRNAPRILDLDIISYGSKIVDEDGFQIPHPRMSERAFVLMPLKDICPDWVHPVSQVGIDDLIDALPLDQICVPTDYKLVDE